MQLSLVLYCVGGGGGVRCDALLCVLVACALASLCRVTQRYLWSYRPLTSHMPICAFVLTAFCAGGWGGSADTAVGGRRACVSGGLRAVMGDAAGQAPPLHFLVQDEGCRVTGACGGGGRVGGARPRSLYNPRSSPPVIVLWWFSPQQTPTPTPTPQPPQPPQPTRSFRDHECALPSCTMHIAVWYTKHGQAGGKDSQGKACSITIA